MRDTFLKSFAKSGAAKELIEFVLQPMLDEVRDVTNDEGPEYINATQGELYTGKKIAAGSIQRLVDDIEYYQEDRVKHKDPRDKLN